MFFPAISSPEFHILRYMETCLKRRNTSKGVDRSWNPPTGTWLKGGKRLSVTNPGVRRRGTAPTRPRPETRWLCRSSRQRLHTWSRREDADQKSRKRRSGPNPAIKMWNGDNFQTLLSHADVLLGGKEKVVTILKERKKLSLW